MTAASKRKIIRDLAWTINFYRRNFSFHRSIQSWRNSILAWQRFWKSFHQYEDLMTPNSLPILKSLYPCLDDDTVTTEIEPIYFYQDAWAFEHIVNERPNFHVDVGSNHKYVALLSKVVPVIMVDIRPLSLTLNTLSFRQGNILALPFEDNSVLSVSSLCVIEHIGLGRYGDEINPLGTEKAITELKRITAPGGYLYISVPLDDMNRIYFNAHRAFTENYLVEQFLPFEVVETRYIYGNYFGDTRKEGFGTGCFKLINTNK